MAGKGKFIPNPEEAARKREEAMDLLEKGVGAIMDSENFKQFLQVLGSFHSYSAGNLSMVLFQAAMRGTSISRLAAFGKWRSLGYQVQKGERGYIILVPMIAKVKDRQTGEETKRLIGFKGGSVFDVSQTAPIEGKAKPLSLPAVDLTNDSPEGRRILDAISDVAVNAGIPVAYENITDGALGYYHLVEKRIAIKEGMAIDATARTLVHEVAHALADHKSNDENRHDAENVAEGATYVVCHTLGLDTSGVTFSYVAGWAQDKEVFKRNIERIRKVADAILGAIEEAQGAAQYDEGDGEEVAA